ncbi:hypothetical protein BJ165DRAFT_1606374 [Panaeolus papilionaceus]|nr:hypothetical protein BJ165DRAFT_1606374 [Panaeolus papilionaceus]
MEYPGLLNWANSIRLTMSNDSGRQLFKDQVQTHGFLFLDDYLDNIVSGGKQDPLIELVKTPGRKKAIARKPKLMSKLSVVSLSLDGNGSEWNQNNESLEKRSSFTETQRSQQETLAPIPAGSQPEQTQSGKRIPALDDGLAAPQPDLNDLSVIAEDDEPSERSQILPPKNQSDSYSGTTSSRVSKGKEEEEVLQTLPPKSDMEIDDQPIYEGPEVVATQTDDQLLELSIHEKPLDEVDTRLETEDVLMDDAQEYTTHMQIDPKVSEKTATYFPFLPDPAPLRKSIKLGAQTPGAAIGGKRTSWLKKGRDLKALEMTIQKPLPASNSNPATQPPSQGTKRKSGDPSPSTQSTTTGHGESRQSKVAKLSKGESPSSNLEDTKTTVNATTSRANQMDAEEGIPEFAQEGVLDRLKKTVEDLGSRPGKSMMAKSLGGDAAVALAEARAAAEERVAKRDRIEEEHTMAMQKPFSVLDSVELPLKTSGSGSDILDLFPGEGRMKEKGKAPEKPFQFMPKETSATFANEDLKRTSISTTPPNSPPPKVTSSQPPPPPPVVFNKPTPVFVPPASLLVQEPAPSVFSSKPAPKPSPIFSVPNNPFAAALSSFAEKYVSPPLTTHSTLESVQSDRIFDDDTTPAWLPTTQNTEYTQSQPQTQICDEDDSWPVDEKLAAGVQWTFGSKEDSMTWSTLPSQSQRGDTGTSSIKLKGTTIPGTFNNTPAEEVQDEELIGRDHELEEIVLGNSREKIAEPPRSQSQMSSASSESSQSQIGFFGQASKLLSSALGTAKKKQPEVKKVLQKAAEAAKKQQEETDKKAARLKEMESRRQLALQRKAEEEKVKAAEEERKMKEEVERRKREREDLTDKRALKATSSKKDEDIKSRKMEVDKKPELKKPSSSVFGGKMPLKTAMKQPAQTSNSSIFGQSSKESSRAAETSNNTLKNKMNPSSSKAQYDDEIVHPSQALQTQMAARAKAQLEAAKHQVTSESIELPEVNSEYSDSDDEDRKRTFDPPDWAQSPELRSALEQQSTINPDDIFGAVRPLKMEEIFKNRTGRFRARTSSANWTGADRLTAQEEAEYARRMGFK